MHVVQEKQDLLILAEGPSTPPSLLLGAIGFVAISVFGLGMPILNYYLEKSVDPVIILIAIVFLYVTLSLFYNSVTTRVLRLDKRTGFVERIVSIFGKQLKKERIPIANVLEIKHVVTTMLVSRAKRRIRGDLYLMTRTGGKMYITRDMMAPQKSSTSPVSFWADKISQFLTVPIVEVRQGLKERF